MRLRPIAYALSVTAVLAGCSSPSISPIESTIPTPSGAVPSRSLAPATHKWSVADTKCPALAGDAAQQLKVSGEATVTRDDAVGDVSRVVECRWGPDDDSVTAVTAKVSVFGNQAGADAGWQTASTGLVEPEPLAEVGEEAFVSTPLDLRGVQIDVRTGNAYARVRVIPAKGATDGTDDLRVAAPKIAADVIDELVPA
ncbi:hypothetical protein [Winogradskya humida]|uniref:DUF3515 family protein n=1 Tax=Winogradskya humida TaxID=113566 RepID=A0ABQ3ZVZ0_9ACTN|nr:hypothetical protein [Actinoplanes humidus]GIE22613.1 hypothetical protein Ahu01nite_057150 [Actinoplanes humidus]